MRGRYATCSLFQDFVIQLVVGVGVQFRTFRHDAFSPLFGLVSNYNTEQPLRSVTYITFFDLTSPIFLRLPSFGSPFNYRA
jgi:hypothetical protein